MTTLATSQPMSLSLRLVRMTLEKNYLYILSALLMICGCFMLMQQRPVDGGEFLHVIKAVLIFQAYELLIIGTTWFIVRRIKKLDDAFILVAIEMALLYDPTFFTNNLYTLLQSDRPTDLGMWSNVIIWSLVPVKLLVMQRWLQIKLAPRTLAALFSAAFLVYIVPRFMAVRDPYANRHKWLYGLLWMLPLLAALFPKAKAILSTVETDTTFFTPRQRQLLPLVFLLIPLPIVLLHLGETLYVHNLDFFLCYLSPIALIPAVRLLLGNGSMGKTKRLLLVDSLALMAMLMAVGNTHLAWLEVTNRPSQWFYTSFPAVLTGLIVGFIYMMFAHVHESKAAEYRVLFLAFIGFGWSLDVLGLDTFALGLFLDGIIAIVATAIAWKVTIAVTLWVVMLALTIWHYRVYTLLPFVIVTLIGLVMLPPHVTFLTIGIFYQLLFLSILLMLESFGDRVKRRYEKSILLAIALILASNGMTSFLPIQVVMITGFYLSLLVVYTVHHRDWLFGFLFIVYTGYGIFVAFNRYNISIPMPLFLIAGALAFYGAGLWITLHRKSLLDALQPVEKVD